jgi:hypothetical protein
MIRRRRAGVAGPWQGAERFVYAGRHWTTFKSPMFELAAILRKHDNADGFVTSLA